MPEGKRYNIVWFCTDQQRFDTIGALNNAAIHTPNLDRLVQEGTAMTRSYCQAPICTPSRASFLTGRYPRTTRATFNGNDHFSADETLVTKLFANAGYTCGLVGKLHLTGAKNRLERRTDDGYTMFEWSHHPQNDWASGIDGYQTWLKEKGIVWEDHYKGCHWLDSASSPINEGYHKPVYEEGHLDYEGIKPEYHQTTWCVEKAIEFMEKNQGNPWLISINPFDPHHPADPPAEYREKIDPAQLPLPAWSENELNNKPPHQMYDYINGGMQGHAQSIIGMTEIHKQESRRDYYAQIELIDTQFGRLLDYLEHSGQREDTIVIFMSDHGELEGDHGVYFKGPYFYEPSVHVPLIISCPGTIVSGLKRSALVELVDIAPTLLELTGQEIPHYMQGKSFFRLLTDSHAPDHHKNSVYCEFYDCLAKVAYHGHFATMYFDGRFKLVVHHGQEIGELYDLVTDPGEFSNLWGDPNHRVLKYELIKKSFDQAVLNNADYVLDPCWEY